MNFPRFIPNPNVPYEYQNILFLDYFPWENGLWPHPLPIPIDVEFQYYGKKYEVCTSNLPSAGKGLFCKESIKKNEVLFPYGGPRYMYSEWEVLSTYYPRMKSYGMIAMSEEKIEDNNVIVGDVLEGNVAGYMNSSLHNSSITNVIWEWVPGPAPWKDVYDEGYVMTIACKDINVGEELFAYYDFTS